MGVKHSFARYPDLQSDTEKLIDALGGRFKEIIIGALP